MSAKRVIISPLDWGLGHTSRIIPIAKEIISRGHLLTVACNETQRKVLEPVLPDAHFTHLPGYDVTYPSSGNMGLSMVLQTGKILNAVKEENKWLENYLSENPQDYIFSDNRFGFHHERVESVYITHQINIQGPSLIKPILYRLHKNYIDKFHHCWIPDSEHNELAGILSESDSPRHRFIGRLTRFKKPIKSREKTYEFVGVVSGPEPQRSVFFEKLLNSFKSGNKRYALIGYQGNEMKIDSNVDLYPHLNPDEFIDVLSQSKGVISRSGYSTIMDLSFLQIPAFFVPTPGQTEQEYLAEFHKKNNAVGFMPQSNFELPNLDDFGFIKNIESNLDFCSYLNRIGL